MALPEGTAAGAQAGGDPGHDLEEKEGIRPGRVKGAKAVGWGGQAHASQGVSGTREEHISDPHLDTASSELEGPTLPRPAQGSGCAVTVASAFCRSIILCVGPIWGTAGYFAASSAPPSRGQ